MTKEEANQLIMLGLDSVKDSKGVLRLGQAMTNIAYQDDRFKKDFEEHHGTQLDIFYKNTEDALSIFLNHYVK